MKREFLQNFKVGDQPLTPEIIDAIMAENGRDIEAAKKPFADYDSIKEQLQTAKDGLKAFEGVDVAQLQGQIATLNTQLADKDKEWQAKLDDMAFDNLLKEAIQTAKGRNDKAIRALLEVDTLKASKNQTEDIKTALPALWECLKNGLRKTRQRLLIDPLHLSASLPGAADPAVQLQAALHHHLPGPPLLR